MENIISKISSKILPVVALAMSLYHLWQVMMPSMDPTVHQDIHLAFALTLVFLSAMNVKKSDKPGRVLISQIFSIIFMVFSLVSTIISTSTLTLWSTVPAATPPWTPSSV